MVKKWIKIKETGQLYLEKIIVSFDVQILFVCNDFENRKYICLNVDDENGTTVIAETDNKMLISMLKDIITMESVFRNASDNRIIIAEYDAENEEIITKIENAEEVSESLLPDEGALLELSNENISEYISFLEKQLIRVEVEAFCEKKSVVVKPNKYYKYFAVKDVNIISSNGITLADTKMKCSYDINNSNKIVA